MAIGMSPAHSSELVRAMMTCCHLKLCDAITAWSQASYYIRIIVRSNVYINKFHVHQCQARIEI